MREPKFTPGPWRVQETIPGRATILQNTSPAHALVIAACVTLGEAAANNAHLIAAAPEMYTLIEAFRETAAALLEGDTAEAWVSDCDQILAKARGEQ